MENEETTGAIGSGTFGGGREKPTYIQILEKEVASFKQQADNLNKRVEAIQQVIDVLGENEEIADKFNNLIM